MCTESYEGAGVWGSGDLGSGGMGVFESRGLGVWRYGGMGVVSFVCLESWVYRGLKELGVWWSSVWVSDSVVLNEEEKNNTRSTRKFKV